MGEINPYASPQHAAQPPPQPQRARFFTPLAVAVHTVIFPWLGAVLAAINFRRLGNSAAALRSLLVYAAPSVALHVITIAAKRPALDLAFRLLGIALAVILYREQRVAVTPQFEAGAARARWYFVWLTLLPILFVMLIIWQLLSPIPKH